MPELPEVETVMRGLEPAMTNKKIKSVLKRRANLRIPFPVNLESALEGRTVRSLTRRGKYILISFDSDDILVIHLGMSGRILIISDKNYDPEKHDHLLLILSDGISIVYNDPRRFGMVFLTSQDEFSSHKAFKDMGPEPLGNDFNAPILKQRLKGKKTSIKQALLDQRVVCGLGNIYVCEALYDANISPTAIAGDISLVRLEVLTKEIKSVLMRAIKAGGSTLKDYRHADGELGYFQHSFSVYDKEGQSCRLCDCDIVKTNGVKRIVQSGRSTFYCSKRQKR